MHNIFRHRFKKIEIVSNLVTRSYLYNFLQTITFVILCRIHGRFEISVCLVIVFKSLKVSRGQLADSIGRAVANQRPVSRFPRSTQPREPMRREPTALSHTLLTTLLLRDSLQKTPLSHSSPGTSLRASKPNQPTQA